ncbi:cytochrome P450 [Streptomyces sp. NPDC050564]|uniref:cytochrome P450 n=1 Tax=Streptomyces sp. NPDC050564 TaxID=3365631 RepID=UPI0037BA80CC
MSGPGPVAVIAELLGIPEGDRQDFRRWTSLAFQVGHPEYAMAVASLHGFLRRLVEDKRRAPGDDLLSALVAARDEGDGRLSRDELAGTAALLVIAGHETTVNLLGNAVPALLQHPDQFQMLRGGPGLLSNAIEEFLRYDTSVECTTNRYAAEDLELGGVGIPRRGIVAVALASASRDAPCPTVAIRTRSTSPVPPPGTSPSATASTTAWAPRWPAWRPASPCTPCSPESRTWNSRSPPIPSTGSRPGWCAGCCRCRFGTASGELTHSKSSPP